MASKKQKKKNKPVLDDPDRKAKGLGFSSYKEYKNFCRQHNLNPNQSNAEKVRRIEKEVTIKQVVKENKKRKNLIQRIFSEEGISKKELQALSRVSGHRELVKYRKRFFGEDLRYLTSFISFLDKESKLIDKRIYTILVLFNYRKIWIRDFKDWKSPSHNADKQASSLIRHLLTKYHVPAFMDETWDRISSLNFERESSEQKKFREWFIAIGNGFNIRKLSGLPFKLTKKAAHHFMKAPSNYSIMDAFRWGQIYSLGGDGRLVDAILGTRLRNIFGHYEFWESVIRFFIANPMLDYRQIGPIIDYIQNQRFTPQQVMENGRWVSTPPPQPNFCMKGRNPETLLAQVDAWHHSLRKADRSQAVNWEPSDINDFEFIEKKGGRKIKWKLIELCSKKALFAEGRAMHHCVASYAFSCAKRKTSIWSLSYVDELTNEGKNCATIEVDLQNRNISQIRGKYNTDPKQNEKNIIQRWATKERLQLGRYCFL